MTPEELSQYDGKEGRKAYVAYKGNVYDVTDSHMWADGEHEGMHRAGVDLTAAMAEAPHDDDVFQDFSKVALLEPASTSAKGHHINSKEHWRRLYYKYHPHPLTVHFPIALHFFAAGLDLAFFLNPQEYLEKSVFYAFFTATVMGLFAMIPGILSWWINYDFKKIPALIIKLYVSIVTLLLGVAAILLRFDDIHVAYHDDMAGIFYHFSILVTVPAVIVLAYFGGKLVWGNHRT